MIPNEPQTIESVAAPHLETKNMFVQSLIAATRIFVVRSLFARYECLNVPIIILSNEYDFSEIFEAEARNASVWHVCCRKLAATS